MTTRIEALEWVAEAARRFVSSANVVGYGRHHDWIVSLRDALAALDAVSVDVNDAAAERAKIVSWLYNETHDCPSPEYRVIILSLMRSIKRGLHNKAGDEK